MLVIYEIGAEHCHQQPFDQQETSETPRRRLGVVHGLLVVFGLGEKGKCTAPAAHRVSIAISGYRNPVHIVIYV